MSTPLLSRSPVRPSVSSRPAEDQVGSSPFHAVARVLLVATICAAPWAFGAVQPWAWTTLLIVSLVALLVWALGCVHRGVLKMTWSPLYWPFLGFLAIAAVQFTAHLNGDFVATREALLKLVTNFIFFFLAGQLLSAQPENGKSLVGFGFVTMILAFALCGLALAQIMFSRHQMMIYWTFPVHGAPFGPFVNHNNYVGLMEMLLPVGAAYLLSRSWNPVLLSFGWLGIGLVLISIWMSDSRGASLVLLAEGVIWAAILVWNRPRGVSPRLFVVLFGVSLLSAGAFAWMVSTGRVGGRSWTAFSTDRSMEAQLGDRLLVGRDTLHILSTHLGLGIGVGCFESVFPKYMTFPTDWHWTHAHDDVLEGAAETGLPGTIMILAALVIFFRLAFRHVSSRLRHGYGWVQVGAAVASIGLLCHSFVDFNLRVPANAAWFVVCVAVATQPRAGQSSRLRNWDSDSSSVERSSELIN